MATILAVDDSDQNLYHLQILLRSGGYHVETAHNGAEALSKARQHPPDLIVSDVLMPVMDGFSLCRECQRDARLKGIPLVFYTATYTDDRDREFALGLGARRFLIKPEHLQELLPAIREELQQVEQAARVSDALPRADVVPQAVSQSIDEEMGFLKLYNDVLVRKLEQKVLELEQTNRELARELTERQQAEVKIQEQLQELQRWHDVTLDREGRVMELKQEVNRLLAQQGLPPRYSSVMK